MLLKLNSFLQMMLLKLNKEGPFKKEVFRAPGHAQSMRKLVHFLQQVLADNDAHERCLEAFKHKSHTDSHPGPAGEHPELFSQHNRQRHQEIP